jgi:hypothetical protein
MESLTALAGEAFLLLFHLKNDKLRALAAQLGGDARSSYCSLGKGRTDKLLSLVDAE